MPSQQQQWLRGPFNGLHLAALAGSTVLTATLLSRGSPHPDQGTPQGFTPLMAGAAKGYLDIVMILLDNGADPTIRADDGTTALYLAAQNGHSAVVAVLESRGADLEAKRSNSGATPLHAAAQEGHLEVLKALLGHGVAHEPRLRTGETPLHLASGKGHWRVLEALIETGPDLEAQQEQGHTPLHVAALEGQLNTVNTLVKANANIRATTEEGSTPMHLAARVGRSTVARALVIGGASDANARNKFGETPLFCAVAFDRCSPKVVRVLVDAGADTTSALRVSDPWRWGVTLNETPLETTVRSLRTKKVGGEDATEEQLHGLEGIRRLLLRVDAVHAVSWLWCDGAWPTTVGGAAEGSGTNKIASTPLRMMLSTLKRRRRGALLGNIFRWVVSIPWAVGCFSTHFERDAMP